MISQQKIKCEKCEQIFTSQQYLDQHTNSKYSCENIQCSKCGKCFNSQSTRYRHMKKNLCAAQSYIECDICNERLSST